MQYRNFSVSGRALRLLTGGALLACAMGSMAQTALLDDGSLHVSGFGTLGVAHVDAPDGWGYRRDTTQSGSQKGWTAKTDSRLGLQLNYAPTQQFELVGQTVVAPRAPFMPADASMSWAFAAFRPDAQNIVRAGRLNTDVFLMADYRNVGYAYLMARPPTEFYGFLPASFDGIDYARTWSTDDTRWRLKLFTGKSHLGEYAVDGRVNVGSIKGLTFSREQDGLLLRGSICRGRIKNDVGALQPLLEGLSSVAAMPVPEVAAQAAGLRSQLSTGGKMGNYYSLALSYERADWLLTTELMRLSGLYGDAPMGAYLNIGRRLGGELTLYGAFSVANAGSDAVAAPQWESALTPVVGAASAQALQQLGLASQTAASAGFRQRTLALGARWDVHPKVALKFQWDHTQTRSHGSNFWAPATSDAGHANIVSVLMDFVW